VSIRTARISGKIFKLKSGTIINSNINKKNLVKILEIKYNQVKRAGAQAMGNWREVAVLATRSPRPGGKNYKIIFGTPEKGH